MKIFGKIIGIIFLLFSYLLAKNAYQDEVMFNSIFGYWISYLIGYWGIAFTIPNIIDKNRFVSFIFSKVLIIPVILFVKIQYFIAPILTILSFLIIYIFPAQIILIIVNIYPALKPFSEGFVYLISIVSVLLFAYKGNSVMKFIIDIHKPKLYRELLQRYSITIFTRITTYTIMILIYVIFNFVEFSNIQIVIFSKDLLNVIKEVFVTFVAIDSLIQIINRKTPTTISKGE
ncbi:hypothetical protein [Oceanobacillus halotolerans]|uniref:hypothetical protein n=1 Tax=Oceanobacillus halotolerans TaxID=2663380 RepID=UPI0013DAF102|nr:hypothetical protein [Oceanobacillus halotolerans]